MGSRGAHSGNLLTGLSAHYHTLLSNNDSLYLTYKVSDIITIIKIKIKLSRPCSVPPGKWIVSDEPSFTGNSDAGHYQQILLVSLACQKAHGLLNKLHQVFLLLFFQATNFAYTKKT